jgi:hypothetical protein
VAGNGLLWTSPATSPLAEQGEELEVDTETEAIVVDEQSKRLRHAQQAEGYLDFQRDLIEVVANWLRANYEGQYSFALRPLMEGVAKLRDEALVHVRKAQGLDRDDIAF